MIHRRDRINTEEEDNRTQAGSEVRGYQQWNRSPLHWKYNTMEKESPGSYPHPSPREQQPGQWTTTRLHMATIPSATPESVYHI